MLYLALAVATISVLGRGRGDQRAARRAAAGRRRAGGDRAAAVAAVVLTLGAVNAYVTGAAEMAAELTRPGAGPPGPGPGPRARAPAPGGGRGRPAWC